MIVIGVAILFDWERQFQMAVLNAVPGYGSGLNRYRRQRQCLQGPG
jgi:hypothetical protein